MPYAISSMQSVICSLQSAVCSLQSAVCSLQSAVCSLQYAVCSLQYAVCSMQYAVCTMQYTVDSMQPSLCSMPYPNSMQKIMHLSEFCTCLPWVCYYFRSYSVIVRVRVVLKSTVFFLTDVSTTCAEVIFRVK